MPSLPCMPVNAPQISTYPLLDAATSTAINEKLAEIISLLHQGRPSDVQLREISACIAVQTANTEKLHAFPLTNAAEPAFTVQMYAGSRHEP
jgi:hypothetical protein